MTDSFDVIVIGAGPAGYVAAIRCAQLGLTTVCIDNHTDAAGQPTLGGTCLNVGCIPSKALLDSSEQYEKVFNQLPDHGIYTGSIRLDVQQMLARKNNIINTLTQGIKQLFKANKVISVYGFGKLASENIVNVYDHQGTFVQQLTAKNIILAPGSHPAELPAAPYDNENIVSSTGALNFTEVPQHLAIIGAGVIGLELGSVWRRLGAEVTLLEASDEFLGAADHDIAKEAKKQFTKQKLDVRLGAMVNNIERRHNGIDVFYQQNGQSQQLSANKVIVAVGRKPSTERLIAPECNINIDDRGFIEVDELCRTALPNVWAIGDAVRGPMLAHKSSEEGIAVAERIAGKYSHVNFNTVPWVIYTSPEIAWVGQTEKQIQQQDIEYKTGVFSFASTGRAQAMGETAGFVKIITDKKTDSVLGAHIIGAHASELIAECVLTMEYQGSAEDLANTIHAHPTLSEAVHEAALAVDKKAIHKFNR